MSTQDLSTYSRVQRFLADNKGFTFVYILEGGQELTITPYLKNNEVLFNPGDNCLSYESFLSVLMVAVNQWEAKNEIASFLKAHPDYQIRYTSDGRTELFSVQAFHVDETFSFVSENGRLINKESSEYLDLVGGLMVAVNQREALLAIAELNQVAEKAMDIKDPSACMKFCKPKSLEQQIESDKIAALEKVIAELQKDRDLQLDLIKPVVDGLHRLTNLYGTHDKAIAAIHQREDHHYDPTLSDLELRVDDLYVLAQKKEWVVKIEPENMTSTTFVVRLTHCDRRYEAFWRENYGSFYVCEVDNDGDLGFVGYVEVEKDQSWTDETFLSVSKSVITAYLKGLQSYHNNRF